MCMYIYLLDISRQLACMNLGRREKYQPIQYCWADCLGYPVHTCYLPIDIQQIYCSAQTGQHSCRRHSCCPVWAVQHIYTLYVHNDCTLIYTLHVCVLLILSSPFLFSAPPPPHSLHLQDDLTLLSVSSTHEPSPESQAAQQKSNESLEVGLCLHVLYCTAFHPPSLPLPGCHFQHGFQRQRHYT